MRCRKGDMAIIIKGAYSGYVVDALKFIGVSLGANFPLEGAHREGIKNIAADKNLLPIRPVDLHETEESERELTV